MPTHNKTAYYLKTATGLFILLMLLRWVWIVFSKNAVTYLYYFLDSSGRNINFEYKGQAYIHIGFTLLRIFLSLIAIWWTYRLYKSVKQDKPLVHPAENIIFRTAGETLENNWEYYRGLDRTIRVPFNLLITILLVVLMYFLFTLPYHYDEIYSYMYFSGRGLLADTTFYPVPNNHIFYNIVATVFVMLPVDPMMMVRLPNILISFVSVYYLFKTAALITNERSGLVAATVFTFSFPFIMYSVQARGYAFFIFFSLCLLYCFARIVTNEKLQNRYLVIYAVCAVLGLYTIPTFMYILAPACAVLFVFYMLHNKQYAVPAFIKSQLAIALFAFLLYCPLFIVNGADVFQKAIARGVVPIQESFTYAHVVKHLQDTWGFMISGYNISPFILPLMGLAILINAYRKPAGYLYTAVLLVLLMLSPLPILLVQKSIPFSRSWIYLIIPLSLSIGAMVHILSRYFKEWNGNIQMILSAMVVVIYGLVLSRGVLQMHRELFQVDYIVRDYARVLKSKIPLIDTIQRTNDFSFYLAESMQCEVMILGERAETKILTAGDILKDEMIVTTPQTNLVVPGNYELVQVDNPYFKVYLRKDL